MPRIPLALALVLSLASPAVAAEEVGGSVLDQRLRAMLAEGPSATPMTMAYIEISPPLRDPNVAAAWTIGPPLAMALAGGLAGWANSAYYERRLAEETAKGVGQVDMDFDSFNLPLVPMLTILPILTPGAFGGGHFYAGEPLRGALVTLGGPVATFGGFLAGALVIPLIVPYQAPPPPAIPQGSAYGLGMGVYSGVVACTAYGLWAAWDAYQVAQSKNRIPVMIRPEPILRP